MSALFCFVRTLRHRSTSILTFLALINILLASGFAEAQTPRQKSPIQCPARVIANVTVLSKTEWYDVAPLVRPSGVVEAPTQWPFLAWPDTPLGVARTRDGSGYLFFGSDGGFHPFDGNLAQRAGSITVSKGTLDAPIADPLKAPPSEVLLPVSKNLPTTMNYVGGGPVYRVPDGEPGAGSLLLVYHVERPANPFWSWLGLAKSTDEGSSWRDLGLIIGSPQPFLAGGAFDIGDGNLTVAADPVTQRKFFYIFFPQHCWTNSVDTCRDFTYLSVARAPYEELLIAASLDNAVTGTFHKYFNGHWTQPALTGEATELFPTVTGNTDGDPQVYWSSYRQRFIAIMDNGQYIAYGESADGLQWPPMQPILGSSSQKAVPAYGNAVGLGPDPTVLGETFYSFYTYWPSGQSWSPAEIKRLTITTENCKE